MLKKRTPLLLVFTLAMMGLNSCNLKDNMEPPNIIFIMTDDHASHAISGPRSDPPIPMFTTSVIG